MADEPKYIAFPLSLISGLPDNLNEIFDYGILRFAETIELADMETAYKQVLYAYYRGTLSSNLLVMINALIDDDKFLPDDDYSGFTGEGDTFDPETGLEEFAAAGADDPAFEAACSQFWKLRQALSVLKVTSSNYDRLIASGEKTQALIEEREKIGGRDVTVMMNVDMVFSYYKENKSAYEIDLLRAFLAIKSIIGNKKLVATTKDYILTRMVGARTKDQLGPVLHNTPVLKNTYELYSKRYHMDKLLDELLARGFLKGKLAHFRRIYFSNHYTTMELPEHIHELLLKNNTKVKRDKNAATEKEARAKLNALIKQK